MKTHLYRSYFSGLLIFSLIISLTACQKGDPGPAGPAGANGLTGATGPTGAAGTSNIQTFVYTANQGDWYALSGNPGSWLYSISIPALTTSIFTSGVILVYTTSPANSTETLLPYTLNGVDLGYVSGVLTPASSGVSSNIGAIQILVTKTGPYLNVNPSGSSPIYFKVVLISP